jgi:hypothetical protein
MVWYIIVWGIRKERKGFGMKGIILLDILGRLGLLRRLYHSGDLGLLVSRGRLGEVRRWEMDGMK